MADFTMEESLRINKESWDGAAERFFGRTALPEYGPHAPSEEKLNLFGELSGQKALEIGCGSGHSLLYMLDRGIEECWGIDLSEVQIETARRVCGLDDRVKLLESPMEENPGIPHDYFDVVYSIYALGWTMNLKRTLTHIHSYLKPGGSFIFSWEHPIHNRVINEDQILKFHMPYTEEIPALHEAWKPRPAIFHHRKISTYINALIETGFIIEKVMEEVELDDTQNENSWYSVAKASYFPATMIIKCRKA
ncbi:class I SAM-dependent methyltransferase [Paenibacillus sp. SAF-054]|uniref:class I SAM-dependent methyltransferase n=1 Tax=unclassified Paenibacillus TaxID=185978 RepID=UPI003F7D9076